MQAWRLQVVVAPEPCHFSACMPAPRATSLLATEKMATPLGASHRECWRLPEPDGVAIDKPPAGNTCARTHTLGRAACWAGCHLAWPLTDEACWLARLAKRPFTRAHASAAAAAPGVPLLVLPLALVLVLLPLLPLLLLGGPRTWDQSHRQGLRPDEVAQVLNTMLGKQRVELLAWQHRGGIPNLNPLGHATEGVVGEQGNLMLCCRGCCCCCSSCCCCCCWCCCWFCCCCGRCC